MNTYQFDIFLCLWHEWKSYRVIKFKIQLSKSGGNINKYAIKFVRWDGIVWEKKCSYENSVSTHKETASMKNDVDGCTVALRSFTRLNSWNFHKNLELRIIKTEVANTSIGAIHHSKSMRILNCFKRNVKVHITILK